MLIKNKLMCLLFILMLFNNSLQSAANNEIITNGNLSLFWDNDREIIYDVRGDVFADVDIEYIKISFIINGNSHSLESLPKNIINSENDNSIEIKGSINDDDDLFNYSVLITPSIENKSHLYLSVKVNSETKQNKDSDINIIYQIAPKDFWSEVRHNKEEDLFILNKKVQISSLKNELRGYTSNSTNQKKIISNKLTKTNRDEKIFFSTKKDHTNLFEDILLINFDLSKPYKQKAVYKDNINQNETLSQRKAFHIKNSLPPFTKAQALQMETLLKNNKIPGRISNLPGFIDHRTNINLINILNFLKRDDLTSDILANLDLHGSTLNLYFLYTFEDLITKSYFDGTLKESYIREKIYPYLYFILENIESSGKINSPSQSVIIYSQTLEILEIIKNNDNLFDYLPRERINTAINAIKKYSFNNFVTDGEIKSHPYDFRGIPENIEYLNIIPKREQKELLKKHYQKHYDPYLGFLVTDSRKEFVDITYNLKVVNLLLKNSFTTEGNVILKRIELIGSTNDNYLVPQMYLFKKNPKELHVELIYLYFLAFHYH